MTDRKINYYGIQMIVLLRPTKTQKLDQYGVCWDLQRIENVHLLAASFVLTQSCN